MRKRGKEEEEKVKRKRGEEGWNQGGASANMCTHRHACKNEKDDVEERKKKEKDKKEKKEKRRVRRRNRHEREWGRRPATIIAEREELTCDRNFLLFLFFIIFYFIYLLKKIIYFSTIWL